MTDETNGKKRGVLTTRVIESAVMSIVVAVITAGATGYVSLRVVEARAESDRESIQELKAVMKESTHAITRLTSALHGLEARAEERQRFVEQRLRSLEDRRR